MPASTEQPTPIHTPAELATRLGTPDAALLASLSDPLALAAYQNGGRQIGSSKVLIDAERIFGLAFAFWAKATAEQRDLLVGFSESLLAVGVHQALALRAATESAGSETHLDKTARVVSATAKAQAATRALLFRDQAVVVLRTIAGADELLRARIAAAVGDAATPESLALGPERVTAVAAELAQATRPDLAARVKAARLGSACLERLGAAATALRGVIAEGRPRLTAAKVNQGDIDVRDGHVSKALHPGRRVWTTRSPRAKTCSGPVLRRPRGVSELPTRGLLNSLQGHARYPASARPSGFSPTGSEFRVSWRAFTGCS